MIEYTPTLATAVVAFIGVLASWYGPYRNAGIARDNRLRALYGDIMKIMLAINENARKDWRIERAGKRAELEAQALHDAEERGLKDDEFSLDPFVLADKSVRQALDDACALLLIEQRPIVAPIIAELDGYRLVLDEYDWLIHMKGYPGPYRPAPDAPRLTLVTERVQYYMGCSTYARTPWSRLRLRRAFGLKRPVK